MRSYYFDNNATTRVAPEVVEAMLPFLTDLWGNPSSAHDFGSQLRKPIDAAREKVAVLINAAPREILFTSCGTESDNAALNSALLTHPGKRHILTTAVEHPAVKLHCEALQRQGCEVTFLPVDSNGALNLEQLEQSIRSDTALVTVMWANNETGVIFPIREIAAICHAKGVMFHTDATQAPGKLKIDVREMDADMLTLSAHKLHAPKGIGLLYVRQRTRFKPYLIGGHQERERRAGTENVASIIGFGRAAELAMAHIDDENTRVRALRDRLENGILSTIAGTHRNGAAEPRLPNTSNIRFDGVDESILLALNLKGICASSGSACAASSPDPSHVLTAMGLDALGARGSVRFSLSRYTTDEEVDHVLRELPLAVERLRGVSPLLG